MFYVFGYSVRLDLGVSTPILQEGPGSKTNDVVAPPPVRFDKRGVETWHGGVIEAPANERAGLG
jgi:hypothetical protein